MNTIFTEEIKGMRMIKINCLRNINNIQVTLPKRRKTVINNLWSHAHDAKVVYKTKIDAHLIKKYVIFTEVSMHQFALLI